MLHVNRMGSIYAHMYILSDMYNMYRQKKLSLTHYK